ncbi:nuclear transport factor 2 family protein [Novosphingobium sp. MMS21-SN21R]|uniref:nuclear transport factor 2 family protein n=1 Tax=Novosphingobium sp. MMS21-SN21R TaxID=2969298 RepID=UPI0028871A05|nr:nuclear transport factor 2 family protein [Novosphingobium sp. MMS21-SN21R]MDT0509133.1 nuclear transport factor 2 family protein [Novosphingobium sp. MMS21-SN21R]
MRLISAAIALALTTTAAHAEKCKLSPKQVVSEFMDEFYIQKKVRPAFEKWVDPGYIQHNPYAATGRDAAIAFLEPFVANNPTQKTTIHRIIADGNIVAVHSHGWNETGDAAAKRGFAVVDIFRVEGCKVMEHWDVLSPVPETSANTNTMF